MSTTTPMLTTTIETLPFDVAAAVRATAKLVGNEDLLAKLASYCYTSGRCQGITEALSIDLKSGDVQ